MEIIRIPLTLIHICGDYADPRKLYQVPLQHNTYFLPFKLQKFPIQIPITMVSSCHRNLEPLGRWHATINFLECRCRYLYSHMGISCLTILLRQINSTQHLDNLWTERVIFFFHIFAEIDCFALIPVDFY